MTLVLVDKKWIRTQLFLFKSVIIQMSETDCDLTYLIYIATQLIYISTIIIHAQKMFHAMKTYDEILNDSSTIY